MGGSSSKPKQERHVHISTAEYIRKSTRVQKEPGIKRKIRRLYSSDPLYYDSKDSMRVESRGELLGIVEEEAVDGDDEVFSGAACVADHGDSKPEIDFPFENIVFEGGGSQGSAYIGAIQELEELGLLKNLKRFGGTSIGAGTATLLALGYGSETFVDMVKYGPNGPEFLDARFGILSLIPNFLKNYGWHPNRSFYKYIGDRVKEKLGNSSATFKDLYDQTGRELCVVVTNLTLMMEEYCHVKTTPDLPIRTAVRMSISVPGLFCAVRHKHMGRTDIYVDGGLICNYPIHCYDGWWLSMETEDMFLKRMHPLENVAKLLNKKERFGKYNDKTLGMIIVSDYDSHVLAMNPELSAPVSTPPTTKLYNSRKNDKDRRTLTAKQHKKVTEAMSKFLHVLNISNVDRNDTIDRDEMKAAFEKHKEIFTDEHIRMLFGDDVTVDMVFDFLDANHDGVIDFGELMNLASRRGIGLQTQHIGTGKREIIRATDFVTGLFQALLLNVKRAFLEGEDIDRTVVINVDYIKSTDFKTDLKDREFMMEQGRRGVRAFLNYWRKKRNNSQSGDAPTHTGSSVDPSDVSLVEPPHDGSSVDPPMVELNADLLNTESNGDLPNTESNGGLPNTESNGDLPNTESNGGFPNTESNGDVPDAGPPGDDTRL